MLKAEELEALRVVASGRANFGRYIVVNDHGQREYADVRLKRMGLVESQDAKDVIAGKPMWRATKAAQLVLEYAAEVERLKRKAES